MEDSKLKGGIPAANVSERVWSVPKKRKTTDGNPHRGKPKKEGLTKRGETAPEIELETEGHLEPEDFGYGSNGVRKKKNLQVDVVI